MGLLRSTLAEADAFAENVRQWPALFAAAVEASDRLTDAVEKGQFATAAPPGVGVLFNAAGQPIAPTTAPGGGGGADRGSTGGGIRTRNIGLGGAPVIEGDDWVYENIGGQLFRVPRGRGPSSSSSGGGASSGGGGAPRLFPEFIPAGGNRPGYIDNGAGRNVDFGKAAVTQGDLLVREELRGLRADIRNLRRRDNGAGMRQQGLV